MKCKQCGKEHDGSYGKGVFCSAYCRFSYTGKRSAEKRVKNGAMQNCMKIVREHKKDNRNGSSYQAPVPGNCAFCGKLCKNQNSLRNHERLCSKNPNAQPSNGNNGRMPPHTKRYYQDGMHLKKGVVLDKTRSEIDEYKNTHLVCEICGKTASEATKTKSKFGPHSLCIDHDHRTMKFRGVLCSVCNRQLGWYEKYKEEVNAYLRKSPPF